MEFSEIYFKRAEGDIEMFIPRVKVRYKDELCFSGRKISYNELPFFVLRNGVYSPKLFIDDLKNDDVVFDMSTLISVGVAEVISFLSLTDCSEVALEFYDYITSQEIFKTVEEAVTLGQKIDRCDFLANEYDTYVINFMRYAYANPVISCTKDIANAMYVIYHANPKVWCRIVLDVMTTCYSYISIFVSDDVSSLGLGSSGLVQKEASVMNIKRSYNFKKIGYTNEKGGKNYISDDRGLSIMAFCNLMLNIYNKFGEKLSSYTIEISNDKAISRVNDIFCGCLGNDFIGKHFSGKPINKSKKKNYSNVISCIERGFIPYDTVGSMHGVCRDEYEEDLLFRRAYKVQYTDAQRRNVSVHYFSHKSVIRELGCILTNQSSIMIFNDEMYDTLKSDIYNSAVKSILDGINSGKIKLTGDDNDSNIQALETKFEDERESYEKRIKELEHQLESKSNICQKLSDELKVLTNELSSYYSEDDFEEDDVASDDSLEDMVEFLKDYKLCMVGGRNDLVQSLNKLGLTDVFQVSSERGISGSPVQTDFLCINTQFISHKITNLVRERYNNQLDTIFYYNGTNVESLVRTCYDFILKWLNK